MKHVVLGIAAGLCTAMILNTCTYYNTKPPKHNQELTGPAKLIYKHIPPGEYLHVEVDKNNNITHIKDSQGIDHFFIYSDNNYLVHYINTNHTNVKFKYLGNDWYVDDDSSCNWIIRQ